MQKHAWCCKRLLKRRHLANIVVEEHVFAAEGEELVEAVGVFFACECVVELCKQIHLEGARIDQ